MLSPHSQSTDGLASDSAPEDDRDNQHCHVTVLRTDQEHSAAKLIKAEPGTAKGYATGPISIGTWFEGKTARIRGWRVLMRGLQRISADPELFVVRGQPTPGVNFDRMYRRSNARPGEPASLIETPRRWVLLDFDTVDTPAALDPAEEPDAAADMLRGLLPDEFQEVRGFWQATGQCGFDREHLRFRLGFWLSRPVSGPELRGWLDGCPCDPAVFLPAQAIYTAAPIIVGLQDPMRGRRFGELQGFSDAVPVPAELPSPRRLVTLTGGAGELAASVGLEGFLALMGDGPDLLRFHEPIKAAIASYGGQKGTRQLITSASALKDRIREAIEAAPKAANRGQDIRRYCSDNFLDPLIAWVALHQGVKEEEAKKRMIDGLPSMDMTEDQQKAYELESGETSKGEGEDIAPVGSNATAAASVKNGDIWKDGRVCIVLTEQDRVERIQFAASFLADRFYLRGTVPTVLRRAEDVAEGKGEERKIGGVPMPRRALIFMRAEPGSVRYDLDKVATFWKFDGRRKKLVIRSCPPDFAAGVLDGAFDVGWEFCAGISRTPLMTASGDLVTTLGYDPASELYLDLGEPFEVPAAPGKPEALAAVERLLRPGRGYRETVARPVLLAAMLTAIARPSLTASPALLFDGNSPGVGKGLLVRVLVALATGLRAAVVTEGANPEELEKRIAAAILSGAPVIPLDNISRPLASSTLESILTEETVSIRLMGTSEQTKTRCRALVTITGNNLVIRTDLLRRVLPVRIEVPDEFPERREFDFDAEAETLHDRRELLAAGFTILRAWTQARLLGTNEGAGRKVLGSFEAWSRLVAGAVEWLTGENPIASVETKVDTDPGRVAERRAYAELYARTKGEWFTCKAVLASTVGELFPPQDGQAPDPFLEGRESLSSILEEVIPAARRNGLTPIALSGWLRSNKDKVRHGLVVQTRSGAQGFTEWRLARVVREG